MTEPLLLISIAEVCRALNVTEPRTAISACERHNVPVTVISPKVRGLTPGDFALLMARARGAKSSNGVHKPRGGLDTVSDAEGALLDYLRELRARPALQHHLNTMVQAAHAPSGEFLPVDFVNLIKAVLEDAEQ